MTRIGDLTKRRFDVVPTTLIIEATANEFCDETTPLAGADTLIQLRDQPVIECYVQTHVCRLAHARWASFGVYRLTRPAVIPRTGPLSPDRNTGNQMRTPRSSIIAFSVLLGRMACDTSVGFGK